jgi:PIN domain nuclease of toxin-antitoxin system
VAKVLDSSAVLAVLGQEPGWARVIAALEDSMMSSLNAAEVLRVLVREGVSVLDAGRAFRRLHLVVIPFGMEDAEEVAEISRIAPELSLGDCACIALARVREAEAVLTGDRAWARFELGVRITLIR